MGAAIRSFAVRSVVEASNFDTFKMRYDALKRGVRHNATTTYKTASYMGNTMYQSK